VNGGRNYNDPKVCDEKASLSKTKLYAGNSSFAYLNKQAKANLLSVKQLQRTR
jgi:hypothetical protein